MENRPKRKHPRLKNYDYSLPGAYFVAINSAGDHALFSQIRVGRGLAPAEVRLTSEGRLLESQLLALPERYPFLDVAQYVIMPNHVHILFALGDQAAGASPRPTGELRRQITLMDVVRTYKSLTTRLWNHPGQKLWQPSFYDEVIRDDAHYAAVARYMDDNPAHWAEDPYHCPE